MNSRYELSRHDLVEKANKKGVSGKNPNRITDSILNCFGGRAGPKALMLRSGDSARTTLNAFRQLVLEFLAGEALQQAN